MTIVVAKSRRVAFFLFSGCVKASYLIGFTIGQHFPRVQWWATRNVNSFRLIANGILYYFLSKVWHAKPSSTGAVFFIPFLSLTFLKFVSIAFVSTYIGKAYDLICL